jgi:hypothetical protein
MRSTKIAVSSSPVKSGRRKESNASSKRGLEGRGEFLLDFQKPSQIIREIIPKNIVKITRNIVQSLNTSLNWFATLNGLLQSKRTNLHGTLTQTIPSRLFKCIFSSSDTKNSLDTFPYSPLFTENAGYTFGLIFIVPEMGREDSRTRTEGWRNIIESHWVRGLPTSQLPCHLYSALYLPVVATWGEVIAETWKDDQKGRCWAFASEGRKAWKSKRIRRWRFAIRFPFLLLVDICSEIKLAEFSLGGQSSSN